MTPVQPSPYDVWASADTVKLVKEVQFHKPALQHFMVINRRIANTAIGRDVRQALDGFEVPVLEATITQRVTFAETAAQGRTVFETDANGSAAQEMEMMSQELLDRAGAIKVEAA